MRIGKLRHRVALQSKTQTPNVAGSFDKNFPTVATVWGNVEAMSPVRLLDGKQVNERVTHRIVIRHRTDAMVAWRYVTHDGVRFYIHAARDLDGRNRFLALQAEQQDA